MFVYLVASCLPSVSYPQRLLNVPNHANWSLGGKVVSKSNEPEFALFATSTVPSQVMALLFEPLPYQYNHEATLLASAKLFVYVTVSSSGVEARLVATAPRRAAPLIRVVKNRFRT